MHAKSGQEVAKQSATKFSKNDHRYWEKRVFFPAYTRDGEHFKSSLYAVRIQSRGRRETISTNESNQRAAGKKAVEIYQSIRGLGWEEALRKLKPVNGEEVPERRDPSSDLTVGQYLEAVELLSGLSPRTFTIYARKLRTLVGDIARVDVPKGVKKHDRLNGGTEFWRSRIGEMALSRLTPEVIHGWKLRKLGAAGSNPEQLLKTRRTVNSILRNSKALFTPKMLKLLKHLDVPSPHPFSEVDFEKQGSMRYHSEIDAERLLLDAKSELFEAAPENQQAFINGALVEDNSPYSVRIRNGKAASKHEAFKILILSLCAGLRRKEIDLLQWTQILWTDCLIRITATDCFSPKADSAGDVPIEPEVIALFAKFEKKSNSRFVINGNDPKPEATYEFYRAQTHYSTLIKWLRAKGITANNPIHSLRKEFGSILCGHAGILVASRMLRHSSLELTSKHYIDNNRRVVTGLGSLL